MKTAKPNKQSSPELSTLAGKYVRMSNDALWVQVCRQVAAAMLGGRSGVLAKQSVGIFNDFRKLAASVLAQDQTKGQHHK